MGKISQVAIKQVISKLKTITCKYFLDSERSISQGWVFSTLEAEPEAGALLL